MTSTTRATGTGTGTGTGSAGPAAGTAAPSDNVVPLRAANLIAVASGKGGVGKTWLSISLSQALARQGRRTLLFDGDLGLANVDVQLALMPRRDLGAVISGTVPMAEAVESYEAGHFDILAGRSGVASLASLPGSRLNQIRNDMLAMTRRYDNLVLDLGAGIDATVRHFAGPAGKLLVVTTDEPTALTDAYAFIKMTSQASPGTDLRIVVNMATSTQEGEKTYQTLYKACRNFLHIEPPLAGIIRRDPKVRESIRQQSALLTRYPNCEAAEDVEALARGLIRDGV